MSVLIKGIKCRETYDESVMKLLLMLWDQNTKELLRKLLMMRVLDIQCGQLMKLVKVFYCYVPIK